MRKMDNYEKKMIEREITDIMTDSVSSDYAKYILKSKCEDDGRTFMEAVIDDVMDTSAWDEEGYYNDDDIRLSIGRIFMERLNIEV